MHSRIIKLRFPKDIANHPVVCTLAKRFDLTFNIFRATIYPRKEGLMVMELSGERKNFNLGVKYLKEQGIQVETVRQDVSRDEETCVQCGLCTSVCPTGALSIERPEMRVVFRPEICSACEHCVAVCPPRAMKVHVNNLAALS